MLILVHTKNSSMKKKESRLCRCTSDYKLCTFLFLELIVIIAFSKKNLVLILLNHEWTKCLLIKTNQTDINYSKEKETICVV